MRKCARIGVGQRLTAAPDQDIQNRPPERMLLEAHRRAEVIASIHFTDLWVIRPHRVGVQRELRRRLRVRARYATCGPATNGHA